MSLASGDLTTPQRLATWLANPPALPSPILAQLITSVSSAIQNKLNRSSLSSQNFTRTFNGNGNSQIVLPDYPVTAITQVQIGHRVIPPFPLPIIVDNNSTQTLTFGFGYRFIPWDGQLPGAPSVLELVGDYFHYGNQNVKIQYTAGYLVNSETHMIPSSPFALTVNQVKGLCASDGGVTNVLTGIALTPVPSSPTAGQYIPPNDSAPGVYTFSPSDTGLQVSISYSIVPYDLEEGCIQWVSERYAYRGRVGESSRSLGGQESARYMRGGKSGQQFLDLPPEVEGLIWRYASVIPPLIGGPS